MDLALTTAAAHALGAALTPVPLPVVDDFLGNYNVGQALLLVFVLSVVGLLPLGSRKLLSLTVTTFGLVFALTPIGLAPIQYRFLGIALLVLGPVLYVTASQ